MEIYNKAALMHKVFMKYHARNNLFLKLNLVICAWLSAIKTTGLVVKNNKGCKTTQEIDSNHQDMLLLSLGKPHNLIASSKAYQFRVI